MRIVCRQTILMNYHALFFFRKLGKMSQSLSSAAVIIGALRVSFEPVSSNRYNLACEPIENSSQTAHLRSLIRVFDGHSMGSQGSNISSCRKLRLMRL